MRLTGIGQHFQESRAVAPGSPDRGIAPGLVDDQNIARFGGIRVAVRCAVFGQVAVAEAGNDTARAVQQGGVVKRISGQQGFKIRGLARVEMQPGPVDQEPHGRFSRTAGKQRSEKGILDTDKRCFVAGRHALAPVGRGRLAPDTHMVARVGPAQTQTPAIQVQDPPHPMLPQEPAAIDEKAPGVLAPGAGVSLVFMQGIWP